MHWRIYVLRYLLPTTSAEDDILSAQIRLCGLEHPSAAYLSDAGIALPVGPHLANADRNYFNHTNQHHEDLLSDFSSKGKRVALTGGAGFIGHNLALELKKHGAEPCSRWLQVNSLGYYATDTRTIH